MRDLLPGGPDLGPTDLARRYAFTGSGGVRALFVATLDGRAAGADGRSGSINDDADKAVYDANRAGADAIIVGAGTARTERYGRTRGTAPLVIVSGSGRLPESIAAPEPDRGGIVLVTRAGADAGEVAASRSRLGTDDELWVLGETEVDLPAMCARLRCQGRTAILLEGGPSLFGAMLAADLVDELALTIVPRLVGDPDEGDRPGARAITAGLTLDVAASPVSLLEADGTLLGLWRLGVTGP